MRTLSMLITLSAFFSWHTSYAEPLTSQQLNQKVSANIKKLVVSEDDPQNCIRKYTIRSSALASNQAKPIINEEEQKDLGKRM